MEKGNEGISMDDLENWEKRVESANKLNVLYQFEDKITFTKAFTKTIELTYIDDSFWAEYLKVYKIMKKTAVTRDPLAWMAGAVIAQHNTLNNPKFDGEDWENASQLLANLLIERWGKVKEKRTTKRKGFLSLFAADGWSAR